MGWLDDILGPIVEPIGDIGDTIGGLLDSFSGDIGTASTSNPTMTGNGGPGPAGGPIITSPNDVPKILGMLGSGNSTAPPVNPNTVSLSGYAQNPSYEWMPAAASARVADYERGKANDKRMLEKWLFGDQASTGGDGGRAAAFNSQRNAQVGAYNNQISGLQELLASLLGNLDASTLEQRKGVNRQTKIAKDNVKKQKRSGKREIDQQLAELLAQLAVGAQNIRNEGRIADEAIGARSAAGRAETEAYSRDLARSGGGPELAAVTQEALARSLQVQAIDQALAARLSQAAAQDNQRRVQGAQSVSSTAQNQLTGNAAQLLAQLTAAASQARTDINTNSIDQRSQLQADFARQIMDAQTQRDLAAAQRYVPSGGGRSQQVDPIMELQRNVYLMAEEQRLLAEYGLLPEPEYVPPTVEEDIMAHFGGQEAYTAQIARAMEEENYEYADFLKSQVG